ncbi:MAG: rod shape-determining protein RodA [Candidatus Omnitrophica bacterium]|nr:rod shape-determining protein RodA [Candidatus Omnitrophota bacterium]
MISRVSYEARLIWVSVLLIMSAGLLTLYSASYDNLRVTGQVFYDQLVCGVIALGLMFFLSRVPYRAFYDVAYPFYIINVLLLLFVLFAGRSALGATRWFNVAGVTFQPSEVSKIAVILMLGRYFSNRNPKLSFSTRSSFYALGRDLIYPLFLTLISFVLIFKQPDLGTGILVFGIFLIMLYASGIEGKPFACFLGACAALVWPLWHMLKPYQKDRLLVFMNPNIDPLGAGYTIIQSRIAIGSGQIFGKGWFAGTQNQLNFLPERHTDFIFAVIGEEWGFVGTLFLLGCYFTLIYAGILIAGRIKDKFGYLVAVGIISILTLQVVINMSMTMGLSPVVGITLPFVSYGRTSFMVFAVMMGFLLNLSRQRRASL